VTLLICLGDDRMRRAQYVLLSLLLASPIASGGDAELLVDSARAALAAGKLDEAAAKAKQAIDASPADARPRLLLASIHEQRRAYRDAAMAYSDILSLKGLPLAPASAAEIHDRRGSAHFLAGEIDASIADFDKAIELDPGRLAGHWKRGISYYYAGRFADGRRQRRGERRVVLLVPRQGGIGRGCGQTVVADPARPPRAADGDLPPVCWHRHGRRCACRRAGG
jgi:tetratricopeptide (TPR) repeat protein